MMGIEKTCCLVAATTIAAAVFGLGASGNAGASPFLEVPVDDASVAACVREIGRQADYEGAATVRHDVEVEQRRSIGHKLRISTTILDETNGDAIREYSTICTVTPRQAPVEFRIREVRW